MTAKKKTEETQVLESVEDIKIKNLTEKRDKLIAEIKSKLLPNSSLRSGGGGVRSKHSQEVAAFSPVLAEINELGKILGQPSVGLGHLRRE